MKKFAITAIIGATLPVLANAAENAYLPYIGADYSYTQAHADHVKPNYNGINLNIGSKYNDYFGTEVFFTQTGSEHKKIDDTKIKTSYQAYGLDVAAYLPLGCYKTFDLFATGGIGAYTFDYRPKGGPRIDDHGWGYRIGGGLIYNMTEQVSLRVMTRYVGLDKISDVDHLMEYSVGVRYHF